MEYINFINHRLVKKGSLFVQRDHPVMPSDTFRNVYSYNAVLGDEDGGKYVLRFVEYIRLE